MTLPAFIEAGAGDTVVLMLHGIGGGASIWGERGSNSLQAVADAGLRAVAMDFPGYGASQALGLPTMDVMVSSVEKLLSSLRPRRAALVGHSMGGMVAQEWVARSATSVDALVLACTSASFGNSDGAWQAQFVAERLAPLDAGLGMPGMAARLVPGLVSPAASASARDMATQVMSAVPEATYRTALRAIAGFDRRAALAHISVPSLLLAAADDRTAPPEVMQRMAQRVPGSEYLCLAGAGHIANIEQPAAFNAALIAFLQRAFVGA